MKQIVKKLMLIFSLVILIGIIAGCSSTTFMQEPPELTISIGDKQLDYVVAKNKWDGNIYDREDTFISIIKKQNEIPIFENGSIVEINFKSNPPDKFTISDILIDENGRQIYTYKEIRNIPIELNNGKCTFEIKQHLASGLSSHYEPNKKHIRGFRMIASWGENECEYAFIIKTYAK